ncbi:MAG TPA: hypothetical protein VFH48_25660 [Chloroflexota bacterium]|nr:hypothetical protein [Chloroflexota bacterium]
MLGAAGDSAGLPWTAPSWAGRGATTGCRAGGTRRPPFPEGLVDHAQQHLAAAGLFDHQADLLADVERDPAGDVERLIAPSELDGVALDAGHAGVDYLADRQPDVDEGRGRPDRGSPGSRGDAPDRLHLRAGSFRDCWLRESVQGGVRPRR